MLLFSANKSPKALKTTEMTSKAALHVRKILYQPPLVRYNYSVNLKFHVKEALLPTNAITCCACRILKRNCAGMLNQRLVA